MKSLRSITVMLIPALVAGCSTLAPQPRGDPARAPVVTKLNPDEVVRLARACAKEHGFNADGSMPSDVGLQFRPTGIVWMVSLPRDGQPDSGFWITVDDTTKLTQFVQPILNVTKMESPADDWPQKLRTALDSGRYPMTREELLRYAGIETAIPTGGGRTNQGRLYFDYQLVNPDQNGGKFEVRCYITRATESEGVPLVESAELAYIVGAGHRFVLTRE